MSQIGTLIQTLAKGGPVMASRLDLALKEQQIP